MDNHLENSKREREKETDKSEGEKEGGGGGWQLVRAAFLSHILLCRFCLHTLPLCLFLHNFLLSLVQCIFHFVLTWPALTPASPRTRTATPSLCLPLFFQLSHFGVAFSNCRLNKFVYLAACACTLASFQDLGRSTEGEVGSLGVPMRPSVSYLISCSLSESCVYIKQREHFI